MYRESGYITSLLGYEPLSLSYLCRVLHASAHFDFLEETSDDRYTLTPLSKYLTSSHPKSLKGFVKFYSGMCILTIFMNNDS